MQKTAFEDFYKTY